MEFKYLIPVLTPLGSQSQTAIPSLDGLPQIVRAVCYFPRVSILKGETATTWNEWRFNAQQAQQVRNSSTSRFENVAFLFLMNFVRAR